MGTRESVLITAEELAGLLAAGEPVTLLDVRWSLPEPDGTAAYESGHLPGAVYVSLDDDLTDHSVEGRGRHPLPSGSSLRASGQPVRKRHSSSTCSQRRHTGVTLAPWT